MRHRENKQHAHAERVEEWREIPSAPGYYASSIGRIRNRHGLVLKQRLDSAGYLRLTVCVNGRQRYSMVSRLVCEAFHGQPPTADHEAAHGDGVRDNNRESNLRWATPLENREDMKLHGTWPALENHPRAGITLAQAEAIRSEYKACMGRNRVRRGTRERLATKFNVSVWVIKDVVAGRSWRQDSAR